MLSVNNPNPPLSLDEHIRLLRLLMEGKTQDQISLSLKLSRDTIKKRCKRIREDFGVETLIQAAAVAVSLGWIDAPKPGRDNRITQTGKT